MKKIIYFTAGWCGPCRMFGPIIDELKGEGLNIEKVDVDSRPDLAGRYNVRTIPTLVLVNENGNEVIRKTGVQSKQSVREMFR